MELQYLELFTNTEKSTTKNCWLVKMDEECDLTRLFNLFIIGMFVKKLFCTEIKSQASSRFVFKKGTQKRWE